MDERPQFDAKYQVGVEQIDREHRQLFEIVARVYDSLEARDDKAQSLIRAAAAELLDYTATHFASEEGLMAQAGYPDLAAHREQHEHLLTRARDMEMRIEIEDKYVAVELSQFLYRWLIEHIEASDRKFGEFLIAQGKT
jgi:hemerythrin